MDYEFE
jgi:hypothetical protein